MSLGSKIKQARMAKGWTQAYLAERCGVSVQAVSQWENDRTSPGYARVNEIANILDVDLDWLADLQDVPNQQEPPPSPMAEKFRGRIPIVSLSDSILFNPSVIQSAKTPVTHGFVDATTPFHGICFAVRVNQDEILPPLRYGDLLIFESGHAVAHGDIVIFNGILPGGVLSDTTFGEVRFTDAESPSDFEITALDLGHRIAEMEDGGAWSPFMILGVAIELRRERGPASPRWR